MYTSEVLNKYLVNIYVNLLLFQYYAYHVIFVRE